MVNQKMAINPSKSQLMVIQPPSEPEHIQITLDGKVIENQKTIKILGVSLAADMKFDNHLWGEKESVLQSISSKIAMMKTIKPYVSTKALAQVGAALINSSILYAAPLWGATSQSNIQKIQSGQTRAARIVKSKAWQRSKVKQHRQDLLDELGWPNTEQIIHMATLNLTKKAISQKSSHDLNLMFQKSKQRSDRLAMSTRIDHKGKATRKTNIFSVKASDMYNKLPQELRANSLTDKQFKDKLKVYTKTIYLLQKH